MIMLNSLFGKFRKELGIDLGTANTLVYVKNRGIVINEPSVVAVNTRTEQILAVGHEAKDMLGKTPPHIITTRPLTGGIISDFEVAEKMLRYFMDKVYEDSALNFISRPKVVIGAPVDITEVERRAIGDAMMNAGAREVWIVEEPMAAAIGSRMPVREPVGSLIVEMGGGTCEIAVISLSGITTRKSIKIAGDELNRNIMTYAREVFNLLLGERQAEEIKIKIGSAVELTESLEFPMRGRDLITGLPREVMINDAQVREAMIKSLRVIVDSIKDILEITPPELVADIHERGILLSGGGALLRGIDKLINRAIEIPVRIADDPLTSVVRGTGILLDEDDLLQEVAVFPLPADLK
ncbi:MAG: rod shape-determining protein [Candidatus Magasanikbacteria bacterium RIFCSPHIGHO2_01_FULL_47_8]|uniref:Cell shape-determining protein MreB n=1 Tax=Candidatus Magasanikbacteria bacterium RIFCSPHIGHO2_01_FULL_47_8 TaxID=1798673 RepID=A0A1F6MFC2_9BACT|nr:MAG: rod shape-determining protein [Candidatus Magasanikbacteria bacterium RIFCSPHIGHO2_01_FULL_47_8]